MNAMALEIKINPGRKIAYSPKSYNMNNNDNY
jgi:hypothetical protein